MPLLSSRFCAALDRVTDVLDRHVDWRKDKPALLATAVMVAASAIFFVGNWPAIVR